MELVIVKENDISRAQRKYHDRANHQIVSNTAKRKTHAIARKLQLSGFELASLNHELTAGNCRYHRMASEKYMKMLESLVSDQKCVDKEIRLAKIEVDHLSSQIIRLEQSRSELEKTAVSDNQYVYNLRHANKKLVLLENSLLVAQRNENHTKLDNVKLQQLICDLCGDRIQFNKLWVKIVNRLALDKKMLVDMTDQAVLAFEKGTEYRKRMDLSSRNALLLKTEQINEMNAILRSLDMDTIREKFFGNRMHRIEMRQLDEMEQKRRDAFRKYFNDTQHAREITLNKMKLKSGRNKTDAIIAEFAKQKREFFSQFLYLNNLQLCVLQISALLARVEKQTAKGEANQVPIKQRKKAKMIVEASLARARQENQKTEDELHTLNETLDGHYRKLNTIVETLKCERTNVSYVECFENDQVRQHNIEIFLSMVEYRLKQIMSFVFYLELNESNRLKRVIQDVDVINYQLNELEEESIVHQCAECAMDAEASGHEAQAPLDIVAIREATMAKAVSPELAYRVHNISQCELPKSRALFAKSMKN